MHCHFRSSCAIKSTQAVSKHWLPLTAPYRNLHNSIQHKVDSTLITMACEAGPVLIHDNCVLQAPASPQTILAQHSSWSYTTALVRDGWMVVDWHLHIQRIARWAGGCGQLACCTAVSMCHARCIQCICRLHLQYAMCKHACCLLCMLLILL
jgi:hypothetical protein